MRKAKTSCCATWTSTGRQRYFRAIWVGGDAARASGAETPRPDGTPISGTARFLIRAFESKVRRLSGMVVWSSSHTPAGGCRGEVSGGYGDGIGLYYEGGTWVISHSIIRYNTQDGLDLL